MKMYVVIFIGSLALIVPATLVEGQGANSSTPGQSAPPAVNDPNGESRSVDANRFEPQMNDKNGRERRTRTTSGLSSSADPGIALI